jgi:RNAse (barnase) inhibitor barstar
MENLGKMTGDGVAVVRIPSTAKNKNALFDHFSKSLKFPDYFGANWDAFEECVNDLSWLTAKTILILHEEFVQLPEEDFQIYIDILKKCVFGWKIKGNKKFVVIFGSD